MSLIDNSGDEARDSKTKGKKGRKWGESGAYEADGGDENLDFSSAPETTMTVAPPMSDIDNLISSKQNHDFDIDEEDEDEDKQSTATNRGWRIFSNFVGGMILTKEDLKDPLEQMHQFLLAKNVANEVSVHLCESVEKSLIGQQTRSFESTTPQLNPPTTQSNEREKKKIPCVWADPCYRHQEQCPQSHQRQSNPHPHPHKTTRPPPRNHPNPQTRKETLHNLFRRRQRRRKVY